MRNHANPMSKQQTPDWMLLIIALPIGILIYGLSGGWDRLSAAMIVLTGGIDNFVLHRWTARMATHLLLPTLIVYLVLRLTRLGSWLAPNRLALGALLIADVLILGYWTHGIYFASMSENPYPSIDPDGMLNLLLTGSISTGLVVLLTSTVWFRCVTDKAQARRWYGALLREL